MKVIYSPRAIRDLNSIATYIARTNQAAAPAIERRIQSVVGRIVRLPEGAPRVSARSNIRVVPILRYPYKIFYRVAESRIEILHIRHSARRPWKG